MYRKRGGLKVRKQAANLCAQNCRPFMCIVMMVMRKKCMYVTCLVLHLVLKWWYTNENNYLSKLEYYNENIFHLFDIIFQSLLEFNYIPGFSMFVNKINFAQTFIYIK